MNCTHCNAELPAGANVCEYCGCKVETKNGKHTLTLIFYSIAALVLVSIQTIIDLFLADANDILAKVLEQSYSGDNIAAFSILSNAMTRYDNLIYSTAGLLMTAAAIAMLLKRKGAYKAAMIGGIAGLISVVYTLFMIIAVPFFPDLLVSPFTTDEGVLNAVKEVTKLEFSFTLHYILALLFIAAFVIPSFIFTVKARKSEPAGSCLLGKMDRSTASVMTFLPLSYFAINMKSTFAGNYIAPYGDTAFMAHTMSDYVVSSLVSIAPFTLACIAVYCMLMRKYKYPLYILPALGGILLHSVVSLCRCIPELKRMYFDFSGEILSMAEKAVILKMLGIIYLLVAVYFWIAASARGGIRAWGQIVFAVCFIILAAVIENAKFNVFNLTIGFPLTEIILGTVMIAVAIPLSIRKREA